MNRTYSGALALGAYCLSTGLSGVWVFFDLSHAPVSLWALAFVIFGLATLFFGVAQTVRGKTPLAFIREYPQAVLVLNILTAMTWLAMFAAILIAEPSFESAICQGWIPITVLIADCCIHQARWMSLRTIGVLGIAGSLFALVTVRVLSGEWLIPLAHLQAGIALATLAGITSGLYVVYTSRLHQKTHCSTLDILSTRFWMLLFISALGGAPDLLALGLKYHALLGQLLVLSVVSVMVPAFTFQLAIAQLGDARVSLITPLVPVLSLIAELVLGHWLGFTIPLLITISCIAVLLANLALRPAKNPVMPLKNPPNPHTSK